MWYSSTRSHMGQEPANQGALAPAPLFGHKTAPFRTRMIYYSMKEGFRQ